MTFQILRQVVDCRSRKLKALEGFEVNIPGGSKFLSDFSSLWIDPKLEEVVDAEILMKMYVFLAF
jgi:hypothetical protein